MARVVSFELSSQDPKKAVEFYSNVFNWKVEAAQYDYWPVTTGDDRHPGINGGISLGPIDYPQGTRIQIEVESIDDTIKKALESGAELVRGKMEFDQFYLAYLEDPTGLGFGLIQKK
jgi:predicted enzyme related to lactoylglutathione lyase